MCKICQILDVVAGPRVCEYGRTVGLSDEDYPCAHPGTGGQTMASLDPDTLEPIGVVTIWLCSQHHRAMLDAIRNQRTMPHGWVR